jgi:dipeptidyl aminopeptidase/acylaminoacyl peptidase
MRRLAFAAALVLVAAVTSIAQTRQQTATPSGYLTPPKVITDILDAPPTPAVIVAPDRRTVALVYRRSMPTIAELAQPIHRIAGLRINPKTNGRQQRTGSITGITLKRVADGAEIKVNVPANANLGDVSFSPDGRRLSFTNTKENAIELWVADTATGRARLLSGTDRLNATTGDACDWLKDNVTLLCQIVPAGRGPAPRSRWHQPAPTFKRTIVRPPLPRPTKT